MEEEELIGWLLVFGLSKRVHFGDIKLKTWKRVENNHIFNQVWCELSTENEDTEEAVGYYSELKEEIGAGNISLRPISMEMVMGLV